MPSEIHALYERLRSMPFPGLGKRVGEFVLYDGLLAGCADRASRGERVPPAEVPAPDDETLRRVGELRRKPRLDDDEAEFLRYFEVLDRIRTSLTAERS
jgi:hypothetical protein